jgi:hypothetical protein
MPRTFRKSLALLAFTLLIPVMALRAQQPPAAPPANEPTAKDIAKEVAKTDAAKPSTDPIERIKEEGSKNSQVMNTLSYLSDVIGPRLTASPNMKRANEWTRDKLAGWGLENTHLEAWGPFGKGWSLERFSAQVVEPQCIPLIAYPKAWSPGTDGTLVADVVYFDAKTEEEFGRFKGKLKGAIVLSSPTVPVLAHFEALGNRLTEKELLELADAPEPTPGGFRRRGGPDAPAPAAKAATGEIAATKAAPAPSTNGAPAPSTNGVAATNGALAPSTNGMAPAQPPPGGRFALNPEMRARMELARKKTQFIAEEGAALLLDPSNQGDGGTLFVGSAAIPGQAAFGGGGGGQGQGQPARRISPYDKDAPKIIPQVVVTKEHYNRLVRMAEAGEKIKVAVDLAVKFHDGDLMGYNTVAEIPGTDLKDELVMLGGHMDSWHSGTGATDNAAGCSVAMEAVRILKTLDLKPRRTVRIALWSGEEQGLLGSRAYVTEHFGRGTGGGRGQGGFGPEPAQPKDSSEPAIKPEHAKISAYFNLDNGTGKVRGVYLQGNEAVRPIFRKWLQPFKAMGASTLSLSNTGGTDHLSFDGVGIPGFQFIQDTVEYETRTHHSNQDVFDRIQAEDMKQASVIMAAFVYNTAMRDEKLPRKPTPAPPAATASNDTAVPARP